MFHSCNICGYQWVHSDTAQTNYMSRIKQWVCDDCLDDDLRQEVAAEWKSWTSNYTDKQLRENDAQMEQLRQELSEQHTCTASCVMSCAAEKQGHTHGEFDARTDCKECLRLAVQKLNDELGKERLMRSQLEAAVMDNNLALAKWRIHGHYGDPIEQFHLKMELLSKARPQIADYVEWIAEAGNRELADMNKPKSGTPAQQKGERK